MAFRYICGGILFAIAVAFQLRMNLIFMHMMDDVNQVLPPESQISEFGLSLLRGKVIRLHRQHYPTSMLPRRLYKAWWAALAAFLGALGCVVRFV
jgi:hypothetical protein